MFIGLELILAILYRKDQLIINTELMALIQKDLVSGLIELIQNP